MYENELKQLIDEKQNRGDSLLDLKTMGTMVDFGEKSGSSQPMNGNDERSSVRIVKRCVSMIECEDNTPFCMCIITMKHS